MRVAQPVGTRGSLRWIQRAVAERWPALDRPIAAAVGGGAIEWVSPLVDDDHAEYRDGAFLDRLGLGEKRAALADFWPRRGPQWDALGRTATGAIILVEAKAHLREFRTPGTGASGPSRARIEARLLDAATALGSSHGDRWPDLFYQYANRLAHLRFLRGAGVDAVLALVGFLDDQDLGGPMSAEAWRAAYQIADHVLGLPARHELTRHIVHVFPSVAGRG